MLEAALVGLAGILNVDGLLMMAVGIVLGTVVGFIPGLGGTFLLAMLIPFVFGMDPYTAFALLLSAYAVTATGGSVSAILFNTPGTGVNAATVLDGFPMTQQGRADEALGAALTASGVGGLLGVIALMGAIPILRPVVLAFGPPEFFALTILGIAFLGMLAGDSPLKGLLMGLIGLLLSMVGQDPSTGVVRFGLGTLYLWDGIKQIPVVIGLFAVAEMIDLGVRGGALAEAKEETKNVAKVWTGVKLVALHWWLTLRCSVFGVVIGFLPGLGGEAAAFFCYGHAAQTSKHPETFGKGNIEGVIAPEAANNAKEGGALIPTVAFGVPGSSGMAILLGAFLVVGLTPGPQMMSDHLDIVFSMSWTLAIANLVGAVLLLLIAKRLAWLTFLRGSLLIAPILVFAMFGSYNTNNAFGDIALALFFGLVGYWMKKFDYPKAPLVLGLILGRIAETNLNMSYDLYEGMGWLFRPITLVIVILTVLTIILPLLKQQKKEGGQT